ncbi:hypothetical protein PTI98_007080 [Pleurotus ostreatus]|nr:hypothetical protein PTI98_007080 [Pleurotus ostreatus]
MSYGNFFPRSSQLISTVTVASRLCDASIHGIQTIITPENYKPAWVPSTSRQAYPPSFWAVSSSKPIDTSRTTHAIRNGSSLW